MSKYSLDRFLEACGATGPLRLVVEYGQAADQYVLPQPFALFGVDSRADLRPPVGEFARRAGYLQVVAGNLLCLDLAAPAAGRVGSYPPHQWLRPGHCWPCGPVSLRLDSTQPGIPETGRPARREDLPAAAIEITGGSGGPSQYRIKDPLVLIGKSSQCQVRLRKAAVSDFHCALVRTRAGLWALDLLGRGGIAVNGAAARFARLDDGDELRVAGFRFRPLLGPPHDLVPRVPESAALEIAAPSIAMSALSHGRQDADLPLVSLIAAMQHQMGEQFRLTMTGMMDSFRRMQDDQMRLVWEELGQIRRLTEEVASLRAQAQLPPASAPTRPPETNWPARKIDADRSPATTAPSIAAVPPAAGGNGTGQSANGSVSRTVPVHAALNGDEDVHAWVSRRVAEVQREREGRWQKIVGFLTGSPS